DVQNPQPTVILDLDYIAEGTFGLDDQAEAVMERAHSQVEAMFESCITDEARRQFEEVSNG
ncbi:MAG: TIGR04255 family protein, partial [Bacillota bacterium]